MGYLSSKYKCNQFLFLFIWLIMWIKFKSEQGDEAADSTDSTKPIHLVLQHLRESFSLS